MTMGPVREIERKQSEVREKHSYRFKSDLECFRGIKMVPAGAERLSDNELKHNLMNVNQSAIVRSHSNEPNTMNGETNTPTSNGIVPETQTNHTVVVNGQRYISGAEIGRNQLIRITDPTQCNCKRCNFWRNSQSMFYSYNSNDVVDENVAPVNQTLPFPVHEVSRNGFDDDNCQVITNKLSNIIFHKTIGQSMNNLGITQPLELQQVVWQKIFRGLNVSIISDPSTGKTFSYLPPLMSKTLDEIEECNGKWGRIKYRSKQMCPFAIIICPNSLHLFSTLNLVYKFELPEVNFHYILSPISKHSAALHDRKKVYLLLCTPAALIEAIESQCVDLRFLKFAVFESLSTYDQQQLHFCDQIIAHQISAFNFYKLDECVQYIFVSDLWISKLKQLQTRWKFDIDYNFGSNIEACIYLGHRFQLKIGSDHDKNAHIIDKLRHLSNSDRVLIIANREKDFGTLIKQMKSNSIKYSMISLNDDFSKVGTIQSRWRANNKSFAEIVLLSDVSLKLFVVNNITLLINYTLPDLWDEFQWRFSNLCKFFSVYRQRKQVADIILFFDSNKLMLESYRLVSLMKRMDDDNQELNRLYTNILKSFEQTKILENRPLCRSYTYTGKCSITTHYHICKKLHTLEKCRTNPNSVSFKYPSSGRLQFKIIEMRSPSRFFVRITRMFDNDGVEMSVEEITSNYFRLNLELGKLQTAFNKFGFPLTAVKGDDFINMGDQYAYVYENLIWRIQVLQINTNFTLDILFIDRGTEMYNVEIKNMYLLPDTLKSLPPIVVEVNIANLLPFNDEDRSYCLHCFHIFSEIINWYLIQKSNLFIEGNILLMFDSKFWLDDMTITFSKVHDKSNPIRMFSFRKYLICEKLARYDESHLEFISKQCKVPINQVDESVSKMPLVRPKNVNWAFMEQNEFASIKIDVVSISSYCDVYINIAAFQQLLHRLENEMNSNEKSLKLVKFEKGNYYLAKSKFDGRYHRAYIGKESRKGRVQCYFLDSGHTEAISVNDLRHLDQYYVNKLPFQAMKCRLWGVTILSDMTINIINKIKSMNSMSAYCHEVQDLDQTSDKAFPVPNTIYAIVLVSDEITLNDWIVREYPDHFGVNGDEQFLLLQERNAIDYQSDCDNDYDEVEDTDNYNDDSIFDNQCNQLNNCDNEDDEYDDLDDPDEEFDYNIPDFLSFISLACDNYSELHKPHNDDVSKESQPAFNKLELYPKIKNDDSLFPDIYWHQTDKLVIMTVKILNPYACEMKIDKNRLHFSFEARTKSDSKKFYKVEFNLHKQVSRAFRMVAGALEVVIKLKKHFRDEQWTNLTESDSIYRNWIRRNPNVFDDNGDKSDSDQVPEKKTMSNELKSLLKEYGPEPNEFIIDQGSGDECNSCCSDSGAED